MNSRQYAVSSKQLLKPIIDEAKEFRPGLELGCSLCVYQDALLTTIKHSSNQEIIQKSKFKIQNLTFLLYVLNEGKN